jgi:DNA-binding transcriptional regulator LsrR (DeoR family)
MLLLQLVSISNWNPARPAPLVESERTIRERLARFSIADRMATALRRCTVATVSDGSLSNDRTAWVTHAMP